jgi:CheY-like chemotaxis protein
MGQRNPLALIADDDSVARNLGQAFLNILGYGTLAAWTAKRAIEMTRELSVEVVILDWLLPGGVGRAVHAALMRTKPIPVIVTVENGVRPQLAQMCGALHLLRKPYGLEDMRAAILRATRPQTEN